jgi:23S rRNA pseudouridine1911/1915/1917 synthase
MKKVPFYQNDSDNMQCMIAVYRMIVDHFLHKQMSDAEMRKFVGYQPGIAAWSLRPLTQFVRMGFDVRMIEPFDYARYAAEGQDYLKTAMPPEQLQWQLEHSNILQMQQYIPEFLQMVQHERRSPTLTDIDDMLAQGYLVNVMLNSKRLNQQEGYTAHSVLVLRKDGDNYIIHDPGLPPRPDRIVPKTDLWEAMGGKDNSNEVTGFKLNPDKFPSRLDQYVVTQIPRLSRAYAAKLINDGKVLVNGAQSKSGYRVKSGDKITIEYDESQLDIIPDINLPILYEDNDCVVINKPVGVLTHSKGALNAEATVASFMRNRLQKDMGGDRAGIVHRLDRATSGVLICAKNQEALSMLQKQFADRKAHKTYTAIVSGHLDPKEAVIDMPIERNPKVPATFRVGTNGKASTTRYKVTAETSTLSMLELKPTTGRTHQLRVHLAHIGHPIVGDTLYGGKPAERLYLHAHQLEITLPDGQRKTFTAPVPDEFRQQMEQA